MGKTVAAFLWIFGAVHIFWALQGGLVFWRDLETTFYLAAGLCCFVTGILCFVWGDIENTFRLLDRRLNPGNYPEEDGVILDVTESKAIEKDSKK